MCRSAATCQSVDCCFWVSWHYKNPAQHVGLVQSGHHHHLIEMQLVLAMIWLKNSSLGVKDNNHSLTQFITFLHWHCSNKEAVLWNFNKWGRAQGSSIYHVLQYYFIKFVHTTIYWNTANVGVKHQPTDQSLATIRFWKINIHKTTSEILVASY